MHATPDVSVVRARRWLLTGLSALMAAIALALGQDGAFAPLLGAVGALTAGIGLHRFGRAGPPPLRGPGAP